MMRILWIVLGALVAVVLAAGGGLLVAHRHIESIDPALPTATALAALSDVGDAPVRLSMINTAAQVMARSAVLEPSVDPDPESPYAMSHVAFVLEWADGRILLIDAGMDAEAAVGFGAPLEFGAGADPIVPLHSVAEALAEQVDRVAAIAFTHMHTDHTQGIVPLCGARNGASLPVFQTPLQMEERNYTTRPGHASVAEAGCAEPRRLAGGPLYPLPGFPGVAAFSAGGHTPGSQVFVASLPRADGSAGERELWFFIGDVANHADAVHHDLPKPYAYSLLLVPESRDRLGRVRRMLRSVTDELAARFLVSHDLHHLEDQGLPGFSATP